MQRKKGISMLPVPPEIVALVAAGVWPTDNRGAMAMNARPTIPPERVRRFAPEESLVVLQPPPFPTVGDEASLPGYEGFWQEFGALHQIVPALAMVIGDFGLGSDAPIVLDYSRSWSNPPVLRLRWTANRKNEWVQGADSIGQFLAILGLTGSIA